MILWTLKRALLRPDCTLGFLFDGLEPLAVTCEEPWRWNRNLTSCAPPGTYNVRWHNSDKFKDVFILEDVPGRSGILMHIGNTVADTEGCILPGKYFNLFGTMWGVANSGVTLDALRERVRGVEQWAIQIFNP